MSAATLPDVLARICADTRAETKRRKAAASLADLEARAAQAEPPRGFAAALRRRADAFGVALIAEIKRASPSGGDIRPDFDPASLAREYAAGGAASLSVLTDKPYFQGDAAHLTAARGAVTLPVLRKDFMLDPWQIAESRAMGADCVLLILAALEDGQAAELEDAAASFGMSVLAEVHDAHELERALRLRTELVGINNRNLKTLRTDLATTEVLARHVPGDRLLVAESGIASAADVRRLTGVGARCFLVGESLLRKPDVAAAVRDLISPPPLSRSPAA